MRTCHCVLNLQTNAITVFCLTDCLTDCLTTANSYCALHARSYADHTPASSAWCGLDSPLHNAGTVRSTNVCSIARQVNPCVCAPMHVCVCVCVCVPAPEAGHALGVKTAALASGPQSLVTGLIVSPVWGYVAAGVGLATAALSVGTLAANTHAMQVQCHDTSAPARVPWHLTPADTFCADTGALSWSYGLLCASELAA